jgi:hypothetical protein
MNKPLIDTPSVDNILAVYNGASAENLRWGMAWYPAAHREALSMGGGRAWHLNRNAGIIAALSPMNGWTNNVRKAREVVSRRGNIAVAKGMPNGIGLGANVAKAIAIYKGADPLDILSGDKVTAFYRTIVDPTGDIDPVIDRHAFDIAVGEKTNDKRRSVLSRKGVYHVFAQAYRDAAKEAGIGSAQMQAITWVAWREAHGIDA